MAPPATPDVLKAMLAKAAEMLASAQRDLAMASWGDAASRAYYAAFHAVSAVLATRGLSYASHSQALGAFNRELVKAGDFPLGTTRQLQRLFEDRQTADYDWQRRLDGATARQDVADAEAVVAACERFVHGYVSRLP